MRQRAEFHIASPFLDQLTQWIGEQPIGMVFRGAGWNHDSDALACFGKKSSHSGLDPEELKSFVASKDDWVFGHLSYDYKNQLERLSSNNEDHLEFPTVEFFVPSIIMEIQASVLSVHYHDTDFDNEDINAFVKEIETVKLTVKSSYPHQASLRTSPEKYRSDLDGLIEHMQQGNIYQANYCQEFYWPDLEIEPSSLFRKCFEAMPNPFSVMYKNEVHHAISLSPERFLSVEGDQIRSQPMKGTAPRYADKVQDRASVEALANSEKDRRENVMIVDLVRNDLSHNAKPGSVKVPDLYRIESYPKVHQMYSTVTAELKEGKAIIDVVLDSFPMGSMTGAPKIRAMELIEDFESSKRGIFSGTIGYITPDGKADFNVIIRTFVYNEANRYLSCHAGGGITVRSSPSEEYEESLVKIRPLLEVLKEGES